MFNVITELAGRDNLEAVFETIEDTRIFHKLEWEIYGDDDRLVDCYIVDEDTGKRVE